MSSIFKENQHSVNRKSYINETGNQTRSDATFFVAMKRHPEEIVSETWKAFGKWMLQERERLDLTQGQCAKLAGMKRQQWNRIEAGASTKRVTVIRIADALKVNHSTALNKAGFQPQDSANDQAESVEDAAMVEKHGS